MCAPRGAAPRIGVREVPDGAVSGWLIHELQAGDKVEVELPAGRFTPDLDTSAHHGFIAAVSGITPVLSMAASVLVDPASRATILYANRRADSVMFADEGADLKDAYPTRLQLVHVRSREAQEVELFSGRLTGDRLRVLLPLICRVDTVDHWWLCGPYGLVTDAIAALTDFGVETDRIHRELFYVEDVPPPHADPRRSPAGAPIPALRLQGWRMRYLSGPARQRRGEPASQLRARTVRARGRVRADLPITAGIGCRDGRLR